MMTQSTSAAELARRTPEQIFTHHVQALGAEDLTGTVLDYAENACIITPDGVMRGKDAVRNFFAGVFQAIPKAQWSLKTTTYEENVLFLEWAADSTKARVSDGVDTFIFKDGLIYIQTVRCTIVPKA
jgi:ketosteroid isomerase-like protein